MFKRFLLLNRWFSLSFTVDAVNLSKNIERTSWVRVCIQQPKPAAIQLTQGLP